MAPFTHISPDRRSRFSDGSFGALYAGNRFEVALLETVHHHARFMTRTRESAGWTSQFREIVLNIDARLHDLRGASADTNPALNPNDYTASHALAAQLHGAEANGIV